MVPCTITDGDSDEFENDVGVEWYFFTDPRESNIQKLIPKERRTLLLIHRTNSSSNYDYRTTRSKKGTSAIRSRADVEWSNHC